MMHPMFHVVLVAPEIATNTGNIIRLSANTGTRLHLVQPIGFSMESSRLKPGLDYHDLASVELHDSIPTALAASGPAARRFVCSARTEVRYDSMAFEPGDVFVFGAERGGLTAEQLEAVSPARPLAIPMRPDNRSLNLANAVAVVVYEAWRQQGFTGAAPTGATTSESLAPGNG